MDELLAVKVPTTETEGPEEPDISADYSSLDTKLLVQIGLLVLAVLALSYLAADIVLPIIFAFVMNLLFQPGMRALRKLRVPRTLAALGLLFCVFGAIIGIGAAISGPAASWAQKLPGGVARLEERLKVLSEPIHTIQTFFRQFEGPAPQGGAASGGLSIEATLFKGTQHFASGFFETILILFFLLVSGDTFLRKLVEVVPSFSDKRRVVALSQQIEENVSAYLLTITVMNALVGVATAAAVWACGLGIRSFGVASPSCSIMCRS